MAAKPNLMWPMTFEAKLQLAMFPAAVVRIAIEL